MEEKAARIIRQNIYAAIATSDAANQPWNSPVYAVYDNKLCFYWASARTSQHSRNIAENPQVFLAIYDSSVAWGMGEGVFIRATAKEVTDELEIAKACQLRQARTPKASQPPSDFMGDRPRRIYRADPVQIWTNQDGSAQGFFIDTRVELHLDALLPLLVA